MTQTSAKFHRLDARSSTLVFRVDSGPPRLLYWGKALDPSLDLNQLSTALERPVPHGMLDAEEPLSWLPETGRGFSNHPGIVVHRNGSDFLTQLATRSVECTDTSLTLLCVEQLGGCSVEFELQVDPESGVLESNVAITNLAEDPLSVDWLAAGAIGVRPSIDQFLMFDGRWCHEFSLEKQALSTGLLMKENRLGRTSHHSFPALICGASGYGEDSGEVFGFHLGWSGNHRLFAERTRDGRVQLQFGELLSPSEIRLLQGESYKTPTLFGNRSDDGLNSLSQTFHDFVRRKILPPKMRSRLRPVHFNTWETLYFEHSEEATLALVNEAVNVGAERFVLDDGWFKGRTNDHAGLGDWQVCKTKYPRDLGPIVAAVEAAGLEFGLWIEPEMINLQSELYERHPNWLLGDPKREQPLGRNQYALNLCLDDVQEHLTETIVGLIDRYNLGYLKWDMNRDLCHVVVDGKPGNHRMTKAAYQLFDAVRAARPQVEIETCSSGGGRCDFEILKRTDRVWVSDSHDPRQRQEIERGFRLFFPPEIMGSHVGSERSHTSGRRHALGFRAATAIFGHMGLESSPGNLEDESGQTLLRLLALYKQHRSWLHDGRTSFLGTGDPNCMARLVVAKDKNRALLSIAQLDTPKHAIPGPLRLADLDPEKLYKVSLVRTDPTVGVKTQPSLDLGHHLSLRGEVLLQVGLQLSTHQPDSVMLIELECQSSCPAPESYDT